MASGHGPNAARRFRQRDMTHGAKAKTVASRTTNSAGCFGSMANSIQVMLPKWMEGGSRHINQGCLRFGSVLDAKVTPKKLRRKLKGTLIAR